MTERLTGSSPLVYARIAGLLHLAVFVLGPFAEFFVREGLIVPGRSRRHGLQRALFGGPVPRRVRH